MSSIPEWTRGDRFRKAREHAGLTQAELALRVGLGKNTVTRYETDQVEPRRPALVLWAVATGVDVSWIETGVSAESDADRLRRHQTDAALERILRARRDSNPQPSDLESRSAWAVAA